MAKKTTEGWLRTAVEQLDRIVFEGELDLTRHPYQIYFGRTKGKRGGETIQPSDNEEITLEDFFPTTIGVSFENGDLNKMMANLAFECIKAFFNVSKGKRFRKLCERFDFEPPYKEALPTPVLADKLKEVIAATKEIEGDFPGKAVKFPTKKKNENKKPNKVVFFCPECGLEYSVPAKKLKDNQGTPTCICGTKCGRDLEENKDENL